MIIAKRSIPMPIPAVGGIPYSRARKNEQFMLDYPYTDAPEPSVGDMGTG